MKKDCVASELCTTPKEPRVKTTLPDAATLTLPLIDWLL